MADKLNIILVADTHLGFDYPVKPRIHRRRRGDDFIRNFQTVLDYAIETGADAVIHGGDLFFRARIPKPIIQMAYHQLLTFAQNHIPLYIVPGNHECSRLPDIHQLAHPSIHVFSQPKTFKLTIGKTVLAISGFPFQRKNIQETFPSLVEATEWRQSDADLRLLCIHHSVEGAQVGPADFTFRKGADVISGRDIPHPFDAVLSGHIHRQQILSFPNPDNPSVITPVIYPGSVERTAFAEMDETKGFYELSFSRNASASWDLTPEFIPLPARPMLDVTLNLELLTAESIRDQLQKILKSLAPDAIVRLTCSTDPPDWMQKLFTAEFLRSMTPPGMNINLSGQFFPDGNRFRKAVPITSPKQTHLELF